MLYICMYRVQVKVVIERDMRYNLDARKETGYVGLKNQGATCYMNSLLQYLYHLPFLRTVRGGGGGKCVRPEAVLCRI